MTKSTPFQSGTPLQPDTPPPLWGVILAGGDGKRLLPLTRLIAGDDRPKQFCVVNGESTLLRQTIDRVSPLIESQRTFLSLTGIHRQYYLEEVCDIPVCRLLVQPENKGTTPAILYSLLRIEALDSGALVAIFPSDHHFSNLDGFYDHMLRAVKIATSHPNKAVLLGIVAESPEESYGWIEPNRAPEGCHTAGLFTVRRFWEKPTYSQAMDLMHRGCLWNSFVMVGYAKCFLAMARRAVPALYRRFAVLRHAVATPREQYAIAEIYAEISASSFSNDVLAAAPRNLLVMRAAGLGWTDLGEPARVLRMLRRKSPPLTTRYSSLINGMRR